MMYRAIPNAIPFALGGISMQTILYGLLLYTGRVLIDLGPSNLNVSEISVNINLYIVGKRLYTRVYNRLWDVVDDEREEKQTKERAFLYTGIGVSRSL